MKKGRKGENKGLQSRGADCDRLRQDDGEEEAAVAAAAAKI